MLENLKHVIFNNALYSLHNQWSELNKFRFERELPPLVFDTSPKSIRKAQNIVRPRMQQVQVTEINEDEEIGIKPDPQPSLTSLYINRSLLFSAASLGRSQTGYESVYV